jgi:hypothetical protein
LGSLLAGVWVQLSALPASAAQTIRRRFSIAGRDHRPFCLPAHLPVSGAVSALVP